MRSDTTSDSMIEMLTHQYLEEIQEVILECEHHYKSEMDFEALNLKMKEVYRSALTDGLPERIFFELIQHCLPHFYKKLDFFALKAA